jgi:hypothetical protein
MARTSLWLAGRPTASISHSPLPSRLIVGVSWAFEIKGHRVKLERIWRVPYQPLPGELLLAHRSVDMGVFAGLRKPMKHTRPPNLLPKRRSLQDSGCGMLDNRRLVLKQTEQSQRYVHLGRYHRLGVVLL